VSCLLLLLLLIVWIVLIISLLITRTGTCSHQTDCNAFCIEIIRKYVTHFGIVLPSGIIFNYDLV
jgi:hypothetical protein